MPVQERVSEPLPTHPDGGGDGDGGLGFTDDQHGQVEYKGTNSLKETVMEVLVM